jgi:integrase
MKKTNFTAERVASFQCEPDKQQSIFWDAKTPGLGLRVSSGGGKAYIFESRLYGKTMRITVGDPRTWELGRARTEASRLKTLVDDGKDPREVKAEQRAAHEFRQVETRRRRATFGEAWDFYTEACKAKWGERHYQDHINLAGIGGMPRKRGKGFTLAGPLASLRPLKLSELTSEQIATWLHSHATERPTMAALAFRLLRAFIRWADEHPEFKGTIPAGSYKARKVKEAVPRAKAKDGDCLQREQLPSWFAAVRRLRNPVISGYLQALLLTGARREEMAALKWADVDFRWRSLSIADKIEDAGRTIPLTPYLRILLLELKRINDTPPNVKTLARLDEKGEKWEASTWVFSSRAAADGKIAEPRIAHKSALDAAGLPHLTLHGLRRSFGTLAEWCEVPVGVVAQIQGHKPSAIAEKHYRRRPLDLLRMWHDKIEEWMLKEAEIEFDPVQTKPTKSMVAA